LNWIELNWIELIDWVIDLFVRYIDDRRLIHFLLTRIAWAFCAFFIRGDVIHSKTLELCQNIPASCEPVKSCKSAKSNYFTESHIWLWLLLTMPFSVKYTRYSAIAQILLGGMLVIVGIADRVVFYSFHTAPVVPIWMGIWVSLITTHSLEHQ